MLVAAHGVIERPCPARGVLAVRLSLTFDYECLFRLQFLMVSIVILLARLEVGGLKRWSSTAYRSD